MEAKKPTLVILGTIGQGIALAIVCLAIGLSIGILLSL